MARKNRFTKKQHKTIFRRPAEAAEPRVPQALVRKPPTQYGPPFVILEDTEKNTFEFVSGAWVPFSMTIAECREECQVRVLPQQVNGKTRYEIRSPVT